jgi:multiple sugar transport system ATP-binding protein
MQLRFDRLSKKFGNITAFDIPTLTIESGEFLTFAGAVNSGKSTVLKVIAGLEVPSSGTLTAGNLVLNDVASGDRGIVLVASDRLDPSPHSVALFDEPTLRVDTSQRASIIEELKRLHRQLGTTFICATADESEALALSDRIVMLQDGVVQQIGTPADVFERPANIVVAGFFGNPPMNVVPGILEKDGFAVEIGPRVLQLNGVITENYVRDVFLGVRPEYVRLRPASTPGWSGRVTRVESSNGRSVLEVHVDGGDFVAREDGESRYEVGDWASNNLHVFDAIGDRLVVR